MKFTIRGQHLSPDLTRAFRHHLVSTLSCFQSVLERVTLDWNEEDEGGEQESFLYCCRLRLQFRDNEKAQVLTVSEDLLEAMRISVDRASRLVSRRGSAFP